MSFKCIVIKERRKEGRTEIKSGQVKQNGEIKRTIIVVGLLKIKVSINTFFGWVLLYVKAHDISYVD